MAAAERWQVSPCAVWVSQPATGCSARRASARFSLTWAAGGSLDVSSAISVKVAIACHCCRIGLTVNGTAAECHALRQRGGVCPAGTRTQHAACTCSGSGTRRPWRSWPFAAHPDTGACHEGLSESSLQWPPGHSGHGRPCLQVLGVRPVARCRCSARCDAAMLSSSWVPAG